MLRRCAYLAALSVCAFVSVAPTLAAEFKPVTAEVLLNPDPADWLMIRRTYDGWGYSPLDKINKTNVKGLKLAWSWSLPPSVNEITPLVHDGVMFIASGAAVEALDAASGELLWQYQRLLPDEADGGRNARAVLELMLELNRERVAEGGKKIDRLKAALKRIEA